MTTVNSSPKPTDKYLIINIFLALAIVGLVLFNGLYSIKLTKNLELAKQSQQSAAETANSQILQQEYLAKNGEIIASLNNALPDQNGLIKLIDTVEALETSLKLNKSFTFTSPVVLVENNQYYLPYTIRLNVTGVQMVDFLRQFEKLPYLTRLVSLNAKTPTGLGGVYELTIMGKVYVQDTLKN